MPHPKAEDPLVDFVTKLVEEKGLVNLDEETLKTVKTDLLDRIEDRINAAIVGHLPPEDIADFEKLIEGSSAKEIQDFCRKKISHLDEIIAQELLAFRAIYLGA